MKKILFALVAATALVLTSCGGLSTMKKKANTVRYQATRQTGSFPVTYTVKDNLGNAASATITINVHQKDASNKANAEAWINFLCRPDIAAINFDYLYYTTPNEAALDLIDEEYLEEESVFPDEETINRCESLVTLDPATTELYSNYWKKVKAE